LICPIYSLQLDHMSWRR